MTKETNNSINSALIEPKRSATLNSDSSFVTDRSNYNDLHEADRFTSNSKFVAQIYAFGLLNL